MYYKKNFDETKSMFEKWWKRENKRPLLRIIAKKDEYSDSYPIKAFGKNEDIYLNYETMTNNTLNMFENNLYLCEAYPSISGDLGPGSLALYHGSEPIFNSDTVWFEETLNNINENITFKVNAQNKWLNTHLELIKNLKRLSKDRYIINIPDLIENIDIYAALRGPQNTCFDMMDYPNYVKKKIKEIDDTYFYYYDAFYNEVNIDGYSSFTAFNILGKGKVAKVQCDFSAMLSPQQYKDFVMPTMIEQLDRLDKSLYHLDGKDAIKHLDAIMSYKKLDALQWTPGAGYRDGANEEWYEIYDKVKAKDKCLWVSIYDGNVDDWIESSKRMINRYGNEGLYLLYPIMQRDDAEKLMSALNV